MSQKNETDDAQVGHIDHVAFVCGVVAGVAQAGLFNPYDRALYLSVRNRTPFLSAENFKSPYQGFLQSVGGRALSGGLYFPLEHFFMSFVPPDSGALSNFLAGTGAGMTNALVLNPVSAIKYKTWGREVNRGVWIETVSMWTKGGWRPFGNGLVPTVARDVVFGGCYTFLRLEYQHHYPHHEQWKGNMMAAMVATVVSGPFNLARNVQYGTRSKHLAPSIQQVLVRLHQETMALKTWREKWRHLQSRLRIGWGTARVAVGMAFGHWVYDECVHLYQTNKRIIVKRRPHLIPARRRTLETPKTAETNVKYKT